jgi:hypothetical protein
MLPMEAVWAAHIQTHYITNRDDVPPFSWDVISVHAVEPYSLAESFVPAITNGVLVEDYRFSPALNGHAVLYNVDDNRWPSKDSATVKGAFDAAKSVMNAKPPRHVPRYVVLSGLLLIAILPALFFLRQSKKGSQLKTGTAK